MAEVYGVKPKMFTREWWPYFWMYYKWHTIGIVFAAVCIISFTIGCITKTKYDLIMTYTGGAPWQTGVSEALAEQLSEVITDADGNGQKNVLVEKVVMDNSGTDVSLNYNLQVKVDIELSQEIYNLYLFDEDEMKLMLGREEANLVFAPVSDWAETAVPEDKLYSKDGTAYAVSVEDNAYLKNLGVPTKGLYMLVRNKVNESELCKKSHDGAVAAANLILK